MTTLKGISAYVAFGLLLCGPALEADAAVYNPTADFSIMAGNPNGVWSYGWFNTAFTAFAPYVNRTMASGGVNPQWYGWHTDSTPCISLNQTAGAIAGTPPGWLALHPGPGSEPCVLRWTATTPGHCRAVGRFLAGDGGVMQVGVRHNANWLWQASNSGAFTCEVDVAASDVLDFVVYGGYAGGTTPLDVLIDGPRPAVTRYVDAASANPQPPYLSWDTAATTLQDALDLSLDYDAVLVADGVYAAGTGPQPRHIYRAASPTDYTVVLTVYDAAELASAPSTACVSVVTSTAPTAEAGGPYAAGAGGPPAYFDGSASSDALDTNVVQGVAKYLWDVDTSVDSDGDGTKDNDVDLVGRRPFHVYASAGSYVCKLTVVDAAGQSDTDLTTVDVAANLAPHVVCVPLHGNPDSPHLVYEGRTVTLKGLARDAGTLKYSWDFGDGSTTAVATVTDKYAIQATHAYAGPPDRPFLARLTVWDAARLSGTDEYRLVMRPDSQTTRTEIAVDEGLWWLHKNQDRATGYWKSPTEGNTGYRPSAAAGAVQALLTNGHRPEGDPTEDPYVDTVNRGFDYLFSTLQTRAMSAQTAGNPDTNGNGIGLELNTTHRGYQQGMVIDAIASTQHMLGMARTGIAPVKGAFYFDIVTDMVDALIYGQCDPSSSDRGGWRYDWNAGTSDNSISQWGAISLLAADNN